MSHETFELIDRLRRSGRRAAMATLVRTVGTTPRKEGTKMFVGDDGAIFGSVTIGGCVDARVIEQSADVLSASDPQLLKMDLGDEDAWEIGLTCGGSVEVFVEPLNDAILDQYAVAEREWAAGRSVALVTMLDSGERFLLDGSGVLPAALHGLELPRQSRTIALGERQVYVEILRPPSTMFVFGAGAVAIPLIGFAKELGFRTIVIDGRERFANRERFPQADEIKVGIASEIASQVALDNATPVVLVAHDYKIDVPVLKHALASDAPYIGLLGGRRRGAAILQMLRDDGVAEEQLQRVRNPIGLDLGGETAAEIALAIVSEVVAVTRGRSGGPMSARS
jgi:xanthine dehydrogenase accessory factor